jgi:hypothetical protein
MYIQLKSVFQTESESAIFPWRYNNRQPNQLEQIIAGTSCTAESYRTKSPKDTILYFFENFLF